MTLTINKTKTDSIGTGQMKVRNAPSLDDGQLHKKEIRELDKFFRTYEPL